MNTPPNERGLIERLVAPLRMPRWGFALVVAALAALLMFLALAAPGLSDHGQVWRLVHRHANNET